MGGFFLKRGGVERNRKARGGRGKGGGFLSYLSFFLSVVVMFWVWVLGSEFCF